MTVKIKKIINKIFCVSKQPAVAKKKNRDIKHNKNGEKKRGRAVPVVVKQMKK